MLKKCNKKLDFFFDGFIADYLLQSKVIEIKSNQTKPLIGRYTQNVEISCIEITEIQNTGGISNA